MDKLRLEDIGWILFGLALYMLIANGAIGWVVRRVSAWRSPPPTPRRVIMSRPASMRRPRRRPASVYVPVSWYGMAPGGMAGPSAGAPDMDAEQAGMPRLSRSISDDDLIAFLAVLRGPGGRHRYSANAIFKLVGGDRNAVLDRIKAIREGPQRPVYPKLADDKTRILA